MITERGKAVGRGTVAAAVILLGLGVVTVVRGPSLPEYTSSVTFFVQSNGQQISDPPSAVEFYAAAVRGDAMATRIVGEVGQGLTVDELRDEIEVTTEDDTVVLTATVTDASAERSLSIAKAIAADLPAVVPQSAGGLAGTQLTMVSEPELDPDPG